MLKIRLNLRNVVAIAACLAGFSANNLLAQDFQKTDANGNSELTQEEKVNFTLKKSSKIVIDPHKLGRKGNEKYSNLVAEKMRELGFCCVYRKTDENITSANFVIILHPAGPNVLGFRIVDKTIDKEVFYKPYYQTAMTFDVYKLYIDKFIKDITNFVEE